MVHIFLDLKVKEIIMKNAVKHHKILDLLLNMKHLIKQGTKIVVFLKV